MEENDVLSPSDAPAGDAALLELGTLLGRRQAFGLIGSKCSAADAQCLKQIRSSKLYKSLGLSWDEFCSRHAGINRKTADQVIDRLEEFGDAYFHLLQIMPMTAAGYRALTGAVKDNEIEFEGQRIPITRENAGRIIDVVRVLRAQLQSASSSADAPIARKSAAANSSLPAIQRRLGRCLADVSEKIRSGLSAADRPVLLALLEETSANLGRISNSLSTPLA